MQSLWNDREAARYIERYGTEHGEDLALRIYTSHLIGAERDLVLAGGGNTSLKTTARDILGEPLEVLRVKASGRDLAALEPEDLPALALAPLRRLEALEELSDEALGNQLRIQRLDASAPAPSLETLLHALVPARFIDHAHADAILVLASQPQPREMLREALGEEIPILAWAPPGLALAKAVAACWREHPGCAGMILLGHGLVTFGEQARTSYERLIQLVDRAEGAIARHLEGRSSTLESGAPQLAAARARAADALAVIRGAVAVPGAAAGRIAQRFVGAYRADEEILAFAGHSSARALLRAMPLTPDHAIHTRPTYLHLEYEQACDPTACRAAVAAYGEEYRAYISRNCERAGSAPAPPDDHPRVVVAAGLGLVAFGADARAAALAADIAEHTLRAKVRAARLGTFTALPEGEIFAMEHRPLERAKLAGGQPAVLAGRIALVTGAAGAIGHGIASELAGAGAALVLSDRDGEGLERVRALVAEGNPGAALHTVVADLTDESQVEELLRACVLSFGGLDILVPNAGIAYAARIADMDPRRFRQVVEVNLTATAMLLKGAAQLLERQGTGGAIVLQSSKNVFDPGAGFGAYSASKAGAHQLGKIAALELAPLGVSVNMINADAVFGTEVPSGLWAEVGPERMKARGLDPAGLREYYRERSLLKRAVTPADVGRAVVFFASEATPTTGATLPVDAGIPGAFPR